ncbi:hypothetical protein J1G42_08490 [Cellulomonas sp. zg-ZUI222]|uniref:hypothetical protein n=1 Tax=Cellulomonas TaxID=1707 RepID=UPI001A946A05|nr:MULTISPECIES: hypothetical protein [Cellulomonas]MBO0900222.1 hypothetical protein [Cellulomonas sp. zg-ZUI22]MBO0920864.1 hypothetical protein [Cellulomonas wangleii]
MSDVERRAVRSTYRSLRLAVVVLPALLVTAVVSESVRAGCWLDSLSAYYWTGAHDAFVGALCAVGAVLVVYTGADDVEDALLDVAGLLAFVVALTPTEPGPGCDGPAPVEVPAMLADARTGLTALVVAGAIGWTLRAVVAARSGPPRRSWVVGAAGGAAVAVLAVALLVAPGTVIDRAHDVAAVLLFVAVVGVMLRHASTSRTASARWALAYALLATATLVTLAVVVVLRATVPTWTQSVLVLETGLVALFAGYWVLQTVELWGVDVARPAPTRPGVPGLP